MMKRYCLYLVILLTVAVLNGCIKDDNNHYPDIKNTTWKMTEENNWYRFSFSDSKVHCQLYEGNATATHYGLTDFYADYVEEYQGGRAYYVWKNEEHKFKFSLYSLGPDNVVINLFVVVEDVYCGWTGDGLFSRDNDPAGGYNF